MQHITNNHVEKASKLLEQLVVDAHSRTKETMHENVTLPAQFTIKMETANEKFAEYQNCLLGISQNDLNIARENYQSSRNEISKDMYTHEHSKWISIVADANPLSFWNRIDWKGNLSKKHTEKPLLEDLSTHFESLW